MRKVVFLREAEQGKTSLAYRRFKMSDGHSMFKPLEQNSVKHIDMYIATSMKLKVRISLSFCLSCLLQNTHEKLIRTSLNPCMYNRDLVHQMTFKGHRYVMSRHCPLVLSAHLKKKQNRRCWCGKKC